MFNVGNRKWRHVKIFSKEIALSVNFIMLFCFLQSGDWSDMTRKNAQNLWCQLIYPSFEIVILNYYFYRKDDGSIFLGLKFRYLFPIWNVLRRKIYIFSNFVPLTPKWGGVELRVHRDMSFTYSFIRKSVPDDISK